MHIYVIHLNHNSPVRLLEEVALASVLRTILIVMRLFLSTEEMGINILSSGQHLLLLAVIVCEIKLIWFVIHWVVSYDLRH